VVRLYAAFSLVGVLVPKGLERSISSYILLLDLIRYLELLKDFLAYKLFCYYI
jgi:hypothetical protein